MRDDELRAQLADWVRPVTRLPVPDIRVLRRRARRRGIRRAAAAAAITVVVTAVAVGVIASLLGAGRPAGGRPAGGSPSWPPAPGTWTHGVWRQAGSPPADDADPAATPYIVLLDPGRGTAQVRDAFTNAVVATVQRPGGHYITGIAAAGDDRTFVLETQKGGFLPGQKPGPVAPMSAIFYELHLKPDGRPESVGQLFSLPTKFMPTFAISPDASMLAYTAGNGLETVSLATGTGRSWAPVENGAVSAYSLSWAGDRALAFEWTATTNTPNTFRPATAGVRLLDVTAPGTLVQASRLVIPYSRYCAARGVCRGDTMVTPNGSKVLLSEEVSSRGDTSAAVIEVSLRTGRTVAIVAPVVSSLTPGPLCEPLWSDSSGEQVVSYCAHAEKYDRGHVSQVNVTNPFDVLNFGTGSDAFAW
jgi:hypothetical protein